MFGIVEGTAIDNVLDIGLGSAPIVGKIYQSYKFMKLEKRMNINQKQLLTIKTKIENSENERFYKQEIFPLIVKKLMEDDEDEKAKVIIDGFEYFIDNNLKEVERIYHYYDVLTELRYSDIILLIDRYFPTDMRKIKPLQSTWFINEWERARYQEKDAIINYQVNKLIRLGLLKEEEVFIDEGYTRESIYKVIITDFGRRFLEFFAFDEDE